MIADTILIFIIILLLTYIFEDVMIPQLALLALTFIEIINYIPTMTKESDVYIVILFIINIAYIMYRGFKIAGTLKGDST